MKLVLTSFGTSHLDREQNDDTDIFYRMPPVSMSDIRHGFLPEYAALLLADTLILDKNTYDRLMTGDLLLYTNFAVVIRALYDEGFIQVEDFDAIIRANRQKLNTMLDHDLKELELWVEPLKASMARWHEFVEMAYQPITDLLRPDQIQGSLQLYNHNIRGLLHGFAQHIHAGVSREDTSNLLLAAALNSAHARRYAKNRNALKMYLTDYLSYVNANLLLAQQFDAAFHDWYDFQPFYQEKFLRVARDAAPGEKEIRNVKRLFEISFPEFTFWHPDKVVKALKDKRIRDLRALVDHACKGEVEFDREFANRVLQEVFRIETSIGRFRNIVSYATMPLGFIPVIGTPVQKAVEEAIARPVESHKRQPYRWFYLISELARRSG